MRASVVASSRKLSPFNVFPLLLALAALALPASGEEADPVPEDWFTEARTQIRLAEYRFGPAEDGRLSAPNRAHGLRTFVGEEGFEVVSRTAGAAGEDGFRLVFALESLGRGPARPSVGRGFLERDEGRVDLVRPELREWLVNREKGLEHGFTLEERPAGTAGEVVLVVGFESTLRAFAEGYPARSLRLVRPDGTLALRYSGLLVTDASGEELPARLEVGRGEIRIVFDDRDALYPVTVDPTLTGPEWTRDSNQTDARLGYSVAPAGDVNGDGFSDVIIGAYYYDNGHTNEGKAWVYHGSASGLSSVSDWSVEGNQTSAYLGISVMTAGDVNADGYDDVLIGASSYDNGQTDEGRAYLFYGSDVGLDGNPSWQHESNQASAYYGRYVAPAGDVNNDGYDDFCVAATYWDNGHTNEGKIWCYHGTSTVPSTASSWAVEGNQDSAYLSRVMRAGDVNGDGYDDLIVGSNQYDNELSGEGKAWVYHGSASGLSTSASWSQEGNQANARFGGNVGTAGDVNGDGYSDVIVSARLYDNGQTDEGRVYVYYGASGGLATTPAWQRESNQTSAWLGWSALTAGDVNGDGFADIVLGAYGYDSSVADEGLVQVFFGGSGGLSGPWSRTSGQAGAYLGYSVATAGDVNGDGYSDIIAGAYNWDNGHTNEGGAFVYYGHPDGLTMSGIERTGGQAEAEFGYSVGTAGDVDGDGFYDLIVGAPGYDSGQTDEGVAFVYRGGVNGPSSSPSWTLQGNQAVSRFGNSVGTAGDVNGDGYDDVIVGSPLQNDGPFDEGIAYVFHGSSGGLSTTPAWRVRSNVNGAQFGFSVGTAGDVNADGYSDVLVGAPYYDADYISEGAAFLYLGSGSGLSTSSARGFFGQQQGARLGYSVSTAGDMNGDGYSDVVVGVPYYDAGQANEGRAHFYLGGPSGPGSFPDFRREIDQAEAHFGWSVAWAGDLDGDGYSDVVVGAPDYDNGQVDEGGAFVYYGTPTGIPAGAWPSEGNIAGAQYGYSVGGAGDVDGDGFTEVAVGEPSFGEGRVAVWYGGPGGLPSSPSFSRIGAISGDRYGHAVAGAGDLNGDGFDELVVGAPNDDLTSGVFLDGSIYYYWGNARDGLDIIPRQQQRNGTAEPPIAHLGKSTDTNGLRLRARARTAAGRGDVQMEYEVRPLHTPFSGVATHRSGWYLTSAPASDGSRLNFSSPIDGLPGGPHYHWQVRVRTGDPFFPRTRWMGLPLLAGSSKAFRTSCTATTWYRDSDGDGYGDSADSTDSCTQPAGYVSSSGDCDDSDPAVNPGATEALCDAIDNDCSAATPDAPDDDGDGLDICELGEPGNSDGTGVDNCPASFNPDQTDSDADGWGDECDACPGRNDDPDLDGTQGPCVVEAGWALSRVVDFLDPMAAHHSPQDGLLYVGRRTGADKGLFRINADGSATKIWTNVDDISGIAIDPADGDVFAADDYTGEIFRTAAGGTGRTTWVAGFHSGDDDPVGLAIAPDDYSGGVLAPGEALMVDRGSSNPDEIWAWSPATAEGETVVHADDGTLVDAVDVAINSTDVYVVDRGGASANQVLYEVLPGGTLLGLDMTEYLDDAAGLVFEPGTGDLLVVEGGNATQGSRVVRVELGGGFVSEVIILFQGSTWASIDITPDGSELIVTDRTANRIYVFSRDGDDDGVPDAEDNCPNAPNPAQTDTDTDGFGAACDCDDEDPAINPLAREACDGVDNDCDGTSDEDEDRDGDGYFGVCGDDCNDDDPSIHPGEIELCDGLDNDCNGFTDDLPAPTGNSDLSVEVEEPGRYLISWTAAAGASGYDVVSGSLLTLHNNGGNFQSATQTCEENDYLDLFFHDHDTPGPGGGKWYLSRPVNCMTPGTYDSGSPLQQESRDDEINGSDGACP